MKTILFTALMTITSFANAAYIRDAHLNTETQEINLEIVYFGGCEEHKIDVQFQHCSRMNPTACVATITDSGAGDSCSHIVGETVTIPAGELMSQPQLQKLVIVGESGSSAEVDFDLFH